MKTVDILLKTYPVDYDWIQYLFRSLAKYVTGYRNLVVLLEEQYPDPPDLPANAVIARSRRYVGTDPVRGDKIISGIGGVVERLRAFEYSDAEAFTFVDSDCVFTRPIDLQTDPGINIERPNVFWRTWQEAGEGAVWKGAAAETLGYEPRRETMCGYPFTFPASVMRKFWDFIGGAERLLSLPSFTDWNVLGNFALDHMPEAVTAVNWRDAGPACIKQFWSWHRPTHPEVRAELKAMGLL